MDYKIFTYDEFDVLVKHWWDIMIKSEFPHVECVPIKHDKYKRRTRNLGLSTYMITDEGDIPYELSFSFRLLDGRYKLEFVERIVRHEIGHQLDLLRHGKMSNHGRTFGEIALQFNFNPSGREHIKAECMSELWDKNISEREK